ncbi:hypothetical protein CC2G_008084 [Coprinopsis cinerea AmutBmut pab1-1]|nr:hypothetical protein CC2G_008084 [Coprinopsis cinerea AmutBmut pab1-1]
MATSTASPSSSASTTPMPLTPESTGGDMAALQSKKNRRQTAVYNPSKASSLSSNSAQKPLKPFSRSAAKRESVLALGSIEHLQHYFSQTGIVSKRNPLVNKFRNQGLVPAIGGREHVPLSPTGDGSPVASLEALLERQPPPQSQQQSQPLTPHVKTHEVHPDSLLPEVIDDLTALVKAWEPSTSTPIDVLSLLKTSTRTIQSVRNYVLTLPEETTAAIRARSSNPSPSSDPLALIRRSALDVLASLRDLEERARLPLSDDAYDAQSDGGGPAPGSRIASPSPPISDDSNPVHDPNITFSLVQVNGRVETVPVWVDEDDFDPFEDLTETKRERWDQRLELGNGWLYRRDLKPEDVEKERGIIEEYIGLVDDALFGEETGGVDGERNFEKARRRIESRPSRHDSVGGLSGPRSKSKNRRVSAADAIAGGSAAAHALFIDTTTGGRRRISTGVLGLNRAISEEPETMEGIAEEWGAIKEEEEGQEDAIADGEETEELDDEDLPEWAQRSSFQGDDLGRAFTFLKEFLPQPYHYALIPPSDFYELPPPSPSPWLQESPAPPPSRENFLSCLSSGQLLCHAYNSCVRKSKHPWGFVSRDSVHDVLGLEAREREREAGEAERPQPSGQSQPQNSQGAGWTFRRTDNLRLWIGYVWFPSKPSTVLKGISQGFETAVLATYSYAFTCGLGSPTVIATTASARIFPGERKKPSESQSELVQTDLPIRCHIRFGCQSAAA